MTTIIEKVHLPTFPPFQPQAGRYDAQGNKSPDGNVFVVVVGPTAQVWAVFKQPLLPNQSAAMIFENVPGSGLLDTIVSQWIEGGNGELGENFNQPNAGEAVIVYLGRQRDKGRVKVAGRNSSRAKVSAAAGLLFIPGSEV
jgi:hypothetical protein